MLTAIVNRYIWDGETPMMTVHPDNNQTAYEPFWFQVSRVQQKHWYVSFHLSVEGKYQFVLEKHLEKCQIVRDAGWDINQLKRTREWSHPLYMWIEYWGEGRAGNDRWNIRDVTLAKQYSSDDRKRDWQSDIRLYGKPVIEGETAVFQHQQRGVEWSKDAYGNYRRRPLEYMAVTKYYVGKESEGA